MINNTFIAPDTEIRHKVFQVTPIASAKEYSIHITYNAETVAEAIQHASKHYNFNDEGEYTKCFGETTEVFKVNGKKVVHMFLERPKEESEFIDTITHEIGHVVIAILEDLGISDIGLHSNDELFCYLLGNLSGKILPELIPSLSNNNV